MRNPRDSRILLWTNVECGLQETRGVLKDPIFPSADNRINDQTAQRYKMSSYAIVRSVYPEKVLYYSRFADSSYTYEICTHTCCASLKLQSHVGRGCVLCGPKGYGPRKKGLS